MQIKVSKSLVFSEVQKLAAYVAAKLADASADDGAYPRIALQDEDSEVIESAWQTVLADFAQLLAPYTSDMELPPQPHGTDIATDFSVNASLPNSLPAAHAAALQTALVRYAVRRLLAAWMAIASPDIAARFADYADNARTALRRLLIGNVVR